MAKVSSAAIQCCQFWEKLIIFPTNSMKVIKNWQHCPNKYCISVILWQKTGSKVISIQHCILSKERNYFFNVLYSKKMGNCLLFQSNSFLCVCILFVQNITLVIRGILNVEKYIKCTSTMSAKIKNVLVDGDLMK